jgi:hypothetical protein
MASPASENYFQVRLTASPALKAYFQVRVSLLQCCTFLLDGAVNSTAPREKK